MRRLQLRARSARKSILWAGSQLRRGQFDKAGRSILGLGAAFVHLVIPRPARVTEREWDREHNVETGIIVPVRELKTDSYSAVFATHYRAVSPERFKEAMSPLEGIDHRQFTFVDIGSGKGRALFLASELPFDRIIGLEFASDLCAQARNNLGTYRNTKQQCGQITLVNMDAISYEFPLQPLVVFMFNPFTVEVMNQVLLNLGRSIRERPRPVFIVYADARSLQSALLDATEWLERIYVSTKSKVYQVRPT